MGFWLVVCLALSAHAVPPPPSAPPSAQAPESPESLVALLRQGNRGERRYASRELHRIVQSAVRDERHADPDSFRGLEARSTLVALQEPLGLACMASLSDPAIARTCADLLGLLEVSGAAEPLRAALGVEQRRRTRRAMERALAQLEAAP